MSTLAFGGVPVGLEIYAFVAILGLICGSFVTALSYRLPRGEDFVSGRSRCPTCKTALTARDLVPVFSWLWAWGRCRHCNTKVPVRYPLTEVFCAVLFVSVLWSGQHDALLRLGLMWGLTICLLSLAVIDLETGKLPNGLILFVVALCAGLAWIDGRPVWDVLLTVAIVALLAVVLRWLGQMIAGQKGLGWGDVKLLCAVTVPLSVDQMPVFLASLGGVALATVILLGWARAKLGAPLGPAICAAAFVALT